MRVTRYYSVSQTSCWWLHKLELIEKFLESVFFVHKVPTAPWSQNWYWSGKGSHEISVLKLMTGSWPKVLTSGNSITHELWACSCAVIQALMPHGCVSTAGCDLWPWYTLAYSELENSDRMDLYWSRVCQCERLLHVWRLWWAGNGLCHWMFWKLLCVRGVHCLSWFPEVGRNSLGEGHPILVGVSLLPVYRVYWMCL